MLFSLLSSEKQLLRQNLSWFLSWHRKSFFVEIFLRAHVITCQRFFCAYVLTCYNFKQLKQVFINMFYLGFWYFFFAFFLWNKTVYEKGTTSRNVFGNIYFENSEIHSWISLSRRKLLTRAMTNFLQYNGLVFVLVTLSELLLSG